MKWPAVTKWVSNMISAGVYLYPSDTDKMADYEINQLARQIMSFFSNAPDGFQRPTPRSDFDYWEGVAEIQEQLSDPEQVNTIYVSMMQPLMEATQPSDRSFEIRKRGMEAMESYLAGTFSVLAKTTPFARWRGRPSTRIWKRPKSLLQNSALKNMTASRISPIYGKSILPTPPSRMKKSPFRSALT